MIKKRIWMYWDDLEIPSYIQKIVNHNKKVLVNWEFVILNKETIHDYIKDFPPKYNTLIVQHKSDWIRLWLLNKYGGLWSDISIIYNDVKKIDKLWEKSDQYEMTGFYNGGKLNGIYLKIENFFIMSKKGSHLISLWLHEHERAIDEGFLTYKRRILKEGTALVSDAPDYVYLTHYYCLQNVLQNLKTIPKMNLLNVDDSMYYLRKKCETCKNKVITKKCGLKFDKCMIKNFKTKKYKLPYIKLPKRDRSFLKL